MAINRRVAESRLRNATKEISGSHMIYQFDETPREETITFEFEYLGDDSELLGVRGTCGCTDVWIEGNKIKGNLRLMAAVSSDTYDVNKTIQVALGSDINEPNWLISEETKKLGKLNPNAPLILNLSIKGKIENNTTDQPS